MCILGKVVVKLVMRKLWKSLGSISLMFGSIKSLGWKNRGLGNTLNGVRNDIEDAKFSNDIYL